jgi:hypothetical protein
MDTQKLLNVPRYPHRAELRSRPDGVAQVELVHAQVAEEEGERVGDQLRLPLRPALLGSAGWFRSGEYALGAS